MRPFGPAHLRKVVEWRLRRFVVTVIAAAISMGCVSAEAPEPTPTRTEAPTAAPTPTESSAPNQSEAGNPGAEGDPLADCTPGFPCTLAPGVQQTDALGVASVTLTTGSGWMAFVTETGRSVSMGHRDPPAFLSIFVTDGRVFADPCAFEPTEQLEATPEAIVAWLTAHPELGASEPEAATLGGLSGTRIPLEPVAGACPDLPDPNVLLLFALPGDDWTAVFRDQYVAAYVLEAGEHTIVVLAETVFKEEETFEFLEPILDSIEFTLS